MKSDIFSLRRGFLLQGKGVIETPLLHEFGIGTTLLDQAILQIIDLISHTNGRESVGGKENGFAMKPLA